MKKILLLIILSPSILCAQNIAHNSIGAGICIMREDMGVNSSQIGSVIETDISNIHLSFAQNYVTVIEKELSLFENKHQSEDKRFIKFATGYNAEMNKSFVFTLKTSIMITSKYTGIDQMYTGNRFHIGASVNIKYINEKIYLRAGLGTLDKLIATIGVILN